MNLYCDFYLFPIYQNLTSFVIIWSPLTKGLYCANQVFSTFLLQTISFNDSSSGKSKLANLIKVAANNDFRNQINKHLFDPGCNAMAWLLTTQVHFSHEDVTSVSPWYWDPRCYWQCRAGQSRWPAPPASQCGPWGLTSQQTRWHTRCRPASGPPGRRHSSAGSGLRPRTPSTWVSHQDGWGWSGGMYLSIFLATLTSLSSLAVLRSPMSVVVWNESFSIESDTDIKLMLLAHDSVHQ